MRFDSRIRVPSGKLSVALLVALSLVLITVLGLAGAMWFLTGAERESGKSDTFPAPAFDLADLDGSRHRLGDYSGRVLLVEFWATWCGPCRLQAEILARLHEQVRDDDVEFLAVSLGEPEDVVRDFVAKDPFPYAVAIDPEETLGYALEVYALPTVLIIDPQGNVSFLRPGITDAGTLQQALRAAAAAG